MTISRHCEDRHFQDSLYSADDILNGNFGKTEPYGAIYFIQVGSMDGPVKIGFTTGDPFKRMANIQSHNHEDLCMVGYVYACKSLEADLHKDLTIHRKRGEWFYNNSFVRRRVLEIIEEYQGVICSNLHVYV